MKEQPLSPSSRATADTTMNHKRRRPRRRPPAATVPTRIRSCLRPPSSSWRRLLLFVATAAATATTTTSVLSLAAAFVATRTDPFVVVRNQRYDFEGTIASGRQRSRIRKSSHVALQMCPEDGGGHEEEHQITSSHQEGITSSEPMMMYNSRTRSKEALVPLRPPTFTMYTCGPTVYDSAHVGNFRAFLTYDVLKRALMYLGFDVEHVCNLTDIDDKIIKRANELNAMSIRDVTDKYADLFLKDLRALNVIPANHYPRATNHVNDMVDMIRALRDKGLAYETVDGSWYFDTQQQSTYGTQLVQLHYDDMFPDENDEATGIVKRHFADFCLWKSFKDGFDRDDAAWTYPPDLARGRPGWHLECSAMVHHYFGSQTIDLHGGGVDLKFPHHENEIAQSQGYTGHLYCNCWFHNGFVNIDNEKMSKSLGNFRTLSEACPTPLSVRAYRYLVVTSQYRNPLSFTSQAMQAAQNAVARIDKVRNEIQLVLQQRRRNSGNINGEESTGPTNAGDGVVPQALRQFEEAIRDDLAMPRASAALFALVKEAERIFKTAAATTTDPESSSLSEAHVETLKDILQAMDRMDQVFGIFYSPPTGGGDEEDEVGNERRSDESTVPEQVRALVVERAQAKADKDWSRADALRNQIADLGYEVKDVKDGEPIVSRISVNQ